MNLWGSPIPVHLHSSLTGCEARFPQTTTTLGTAHSTGLNGGQLAPPWSLLPTRVPPL
jgi:hypothetical protein